MQRLDRHTRSPERVNPETAGDCDDFEFVAVTGLLQ